MWAVLLRAQTPACAWCREATADGPAVRVEVFAHVRLDERRAVEEVEPAGPDRASRLDRIRALPGVTEVQILESAPDRARVRMQVPACPLPHAVAASGVLPRFPFEVRDGADRRLLIGEREAVARFVDDLRNAGLPAEVLSSRAYHPHESLTPRQRELMRAAIRAGYHEVPRRVTLTKPARRVGVAKSTLSEALARAERHLLEDPGAPGARRAPETP